MSKENTIQNKEIYAYTTDKQPWIIRDNERIHPRTLEAINEFLLSLKLKNRTLFTIYARNRALVRTFEDLDKPFDKLTSNELFDLLAKDFKKLKDVSIINTLSTLHYFFNFCKKEGYIDRNPVKTRWIPRKPSSIPKYLDPSSLAKVILEVEKSSLRDRTIFEFFLSTGARLGEVYRLNIEDIDLKNKTAVVDGKGNKIRNVQFTEKCLGLLEKYLEQHPNSQGPLFIDENKKRLSYAHIYLMIKELGEKAKLNRRLSPHHLHHTMATMALVNGLKMEEIYGEVIMESIKIAIEDKKTPDLMDSFLKEHEFRFSKYTLRNYRNYFRYFLDFTTKEYDEVKPNDIREFMNFLKTKKNWSDGTIMGNRYSSR